MHRMSSQETNPPTASTSNISNWTPRPSHHCRRTARTALDKMDRGRLSIGNSWPCKHSTIPPILYINSGRSKVDDKPDIYRSSARPPNAVHATLSPPSPPAAGPISVSGMVRGLRPSLLAPRKSNGRGEPANSIAASRRSEGSLQVPIGLLAENMHIKCAWAPLLHCSGAAACGRDVDWSLWRGQHVRERGHPELCSSCFTLARGALHTSVQHSRLLGQEQSADSRHGQDTLLKDAGIGPLQRKADENKQETSCLSSFAKCGNDGLLVEG